MPVVRLPGVVLEWAHPRSGARIENERRGPVLLDEGSGDDRVGDVRGHRGERVTKLIAQLVQLPGIAGNGDHVGARVVECGGDGATEAAACSRYQCCRTGEFLPCHVQVSLWRCYERRTLALERLGRTAQPALGHGLRHGIGEDVLLTLLHSVEDGSRDGFRRGLRYG